MQKFENTLWSGKCPFGEMSSRGSILRGSVSRGFVLRKVSVGELSSRETVLQSLNLLNVFFIKTKNKKTEFKDALETLYYYIKEIKPNNEVQ